MAGKGYFRELGADFLKAVYLVVAVFVLSVAFNELRTESLPRIAKEPYQVYVPCPETEEEAGKVSLDTLAKDELLSFPKGTLLVDARESESFDKGHIAGAVNLPYDDLMGVDESDLTNLRKLAAGRTLIIVYCDGWEDESDPEQRYAHPPSEHLADELKSAEGLPDVISLSGGLGEYVKRGGRLVGTGEGN